MNFILVPFLLAIRVPSDDDIWRNGPEYTFNTFVDTILISKEYSPNDFKDYVGTRLRTKLKCRPKEPDVLICRFENAEVTKLWRIQEIDGKPTARNVSYSPYGFGNCSFEIIFNDMGIESYGFAKGHRHTNDDLMNMYRIITNQLSTGAEIEEKFFKVTENFTMGECPVNYNISRKKLTNELSGINFQLIPLINIDINREELIEIKKTRDLENCISGVVNHPATRYVHGLVHRDSKQKVISSSSRMLIAMKNFTTETVNIFKEVHGEKERMFAEHIQLSLESVAPAQNELISIEDPISAGVIVDNDTNDYI